MAIRHRGIFFPSTFFSPFPPTFNDAAAAACLGSVYFSVQHHDSQSIPDLPGTLFVCVFFALECL